MTRSQWDDLRAPRLIDADFADTVYHARGVRLRAADRAGQRARVALAHNYKQADGLLDSPEAQPVIARLGAACEHLAADIDRVAYVQAVALDVLAAKARPRCPQGDER